MRNKNLFERKLERFESEVKLVNYHINRNERDVTFDIIKGLIEKIDDMRTLLNTESQD